MAIPFRGQPLKAAVDDKVPVAIDEGVGVDVGQVILRGISALRVPVPVSDEVDVLVVYGECCVIDTGTGVQLVSAEGRGLAAEQASHASIGVEDGTPVRPIRGVAVFNDVPFELEDVVVVNGSAAANIHSEPGSYS